MCVGSIVRIIILNDYHLFVCVYMSVCILLLIETIFQLLTSLLMIKTNMVSVYYVCTFVNIYVKFIYCMVETPENTFYLYSKFTCCFFFVDIVKIGRNIIYCYKCINHFNSSFHLIKILCVF